MNYEELKKQKEVIEFIKDIKDLTEQQKNPTRDGMEKVILNIKNKYIIEVEMYELLSVIKNNGVLTNIKNISNDNLYSKLQSYKEFVIMKFIEKYGKENFNKIVKEYELEV